MFRFNLKLLFNNRILPIWPVAAIIIAAIAGIYGDVQSAGNSYSFLIGTDMGAAFPSGIFILSVIGFFVLIAVIGIPQHFNKNLEPQRAALLFSKPISRSEFLFAEFASVLVITFLYSLITVIALAVLLFIEAGIFPYQLYLAILLYVPLYFLVIYVSIALFLILTGSYLASVILGYFIIPAISSFLFRVEWILNLIGWNSDFILGLADVLSYFIPSMEGLEALMASFGSFGPGQAEMNSNAMDQLISGVLFDGFAAFDWQLFGFVIVSCLPFFLLSYYLMIKKEF